MKKIINYLFETIKKERILLTFIIILFILGLVFGSLFINFVSNDDKTMLINQVTSYFNNISKLNDSVFGINVVFPEILNNLLQLLLIFILGISMIGLFAVIIIIFFKGFTLGVTLGTILLKYKLKGVLASVLYVAPCLIINTLIYIFMSFFALNASIKFLKALFKKDNLNFKSFLGKYLLAFLCSLLLIAINTVIDAFLTPVLLKLFTLII